jgi:protein-L-isoaspartate(D-aspartate) O-methyltransferase
MTINLEPDPFPFERQRMVETQLRARAIRDQRVLEAFARVPRHEFVPERYQDQAYEDHPIPIGLGQTISQPYIVALMLEALALQPMDKVLEIGTGSGYQTALLAELVSHVYSIERHAALAQSAERTLNKLGYTNTTVVVGDGSGGLPEAAPFDVIIVSAAAPELPPALVEQLGEGGRMIVPVGPSHAQELQLVRKQHGQLAISHLEACRFVPLVGGEDNSSE